MPPMDEKAPGQQSPMEKLQQLFQLMASSRPQQQVGPSGGMASPGQVGQQIPGGAPPFTGGVGPNIPSMPNMTSLNKQGPMPMVGAQGGPTEFRTKAGMQAQVVNNAIQSVSQFAGHLKQKQWEQKSAQAEQAWGSYLSMQQAIAATDDPNAKKMLQQQLQQMMQDPKIGKIFTKAHEDPTSPEGVGIQRAMQMSQQQAKQKLELEQLQAQIKEHQAKAAQAAAMTPQTPEERGVAMGTLPSADVKAREQERRQELKDNLEFKRESLQQNLELKKQQMEDRRTTEQERMALQREIAQGRLEMQKANLEFRTMLAQEKSKIPAALLSRFNQAEIIKEQVADLRSKLEDKELQSSMGPIAGRTKGLGKRMIGNRKIQDFFAAQESMDALLPILHGYRGGSQIHTLFKHSMGDLSMPAESYKGTLDALDRLADNVITEGKQAFPNDPFWKMDLKKDAAIPESGKIVVSPEDMK